MFDILVFLYFFRNYITLIQKDVEMKNMATEFESKKTALEKSYIEYTREKEGEFLSMSSVWMITTSSLNTPVKRRANS